LFQRYVVKLEIEKSSDHYASFEKEKLCRGGVGGKHGKGSIYV